MNHCSSKKSLHSFLLLLIPLISLILDEGLGAVKYIPYKLSSVNSIHMTLASSAVWQMISIILERWSNFNFNHLLHYTCRAYRRKYVRH